MSKNDTTSPGTADLLSATTKLMAAYDRIERDDLPDGLAELIDDVYAAGVRMQKTVEQIERGSYAEFARDVAKVLYQASGADLCFIARSVLWDVEALLATAIEDAIEDRDVASAHQTADDIAYWQDRLDSLEETQAAIQGALRRAR